MGAGGRWQTKEVIHRCPDLSKMCVICGFLQFVFIMD